MGDQLVLIIGIQTAVPTVAIQRILLVPLTGDIEESSGAQGHAAVECHAPAGAVAVAGSSMNREFAAIGPVPQFQVDDGGNGVGTVLGGGAVAQHLDTLHGRCRYGAKVRAAGSVPDHSVEHAQPRHVVPPLAVDEDQCLVGAQAA